MAYQHATYEQWLYSDYILPLLTLWDLYNYVITWVGGKSGINFTSCGKSGNFAILATMTGIAIVSQNFNPLRQINTLAYFFLSILYIFFVLTFYIPEEIRVHKGPPVMKEQERYRVVGDWFVMM